MKKHQILLLALILALLTLISCNGDTVTPDVTTESDVTTDSAQSAAPQELTLKAEDGTLNFKIVRPELVGTDAAVVKTASNILKGLSSIFDARVQIGTDFLKAGEEYDSSTLEILVGFTSYPESQKFASECDYGNYVISVEGNKIVITAFSEQCLEIAGNVFISRVHNAYDKESASATLSPEELTLNNVYDAQLSALPIFDGGNFLSSYDAGNRSSSNKTQCDEIIIERTNAEEFSAYLEKLGAAGYVKRAESTIKSSRFATYTNDEYMVSAGYYDADKSVRLLVEPVYDISAFTESKTYTKVTDTRITMLGLEYPNAENSTGYVPNGLSFLIRLEDGRFVVVDGGFNRTECINGFINEIREQSKSYTGTPTIAAWIVTHAHGDHEGLFINQTGRFKSEGIKVENVIANAMSEIEVKKAVAAPSEHFEDNEGQRGPRLLAAAEKLGATVYKAHVGQKYSFANLELEVLYTLESYAPNICNALNTSSVVTKMTFSDSASDKKTTLLCTGDATGVAMETLNRMFGDYIQCDILQICHHGGGTAGNNNGTANAYRTVNASLILWPLGLHSYQNYAFNSYNQVVFGQSNYVECYFAGSQGDSVSFALPYVPGKTEITVKCGGNCPVSHSYNENQGIS